MSTSPISLGAINCKGAPVKEHGADTAHAATPVHSTKDSVAASSAAQPTLRDLARERSAESNNTSSAERRESLMRALLAHVPAADRPAAKTAIPAILDAAKKTGSTDPNVLGYLLATAQTESDFGANMVETGHPKDWFNKNYGREDGNRSGTDDGYTYRGRGYVQTTHAGRYAELSHRLGLADVPVLAGGKPVLDDRGRPKMEPALVANPNKLTDPNLAAQALVLGVKNNLFTHNAAAAIDKTIPVGKKPGDADFYHARAIVNGIVKAQAQAIASHATTYAQILDSYRESVLGLPETK